MDQSRKKLGTSMVLRKAIKVHGGCRAVSRSRSEWPGQAETSKYRKSQPETMRNPNGEQWRKQLCLINLNMTMHRSGDREKWQRQGQDARTSPGGASRKVWSSRWLSRLG
jgi:hypothetical protein